MKRRIFNLALFLLLGAIINVGVVFSLTRLFPVPYSFTIFQGMSLDSPSDSPCWRTAVYRLAVSLIVDAVVTRETVLREDAEVPAWSEALNPPSALDFANHATMREVGYGWPMLATFSRSTGTSADEPPPLNPIWPGFAINTILYAAIAWIVFAAPFVIRRRRRIQRGLCPACAYPVGDSSVCTECGATVRRNPRDKKNEIPPRQGRRR